jgi:hypothetical protein
MLADHGIDSSQTAVYRNGSGLFVVKLNDTGISASAPRLGRAPWDGHIAASQDRIAGYPGNVGSCDLRHSADGARARMVFFQTDDPPPQPVCI